MFSFPLRSKTGQGAYPSWRSLSHASAAWLILCPPHTLDNALKNNQKQTYLAPTFSLHMRTFWDNEEEIVQDWKTLKEIYFSSGMCLTVNSDLPYIVNSHLEMPSFLALDLARWPFTSPYSYRPHFFSMVIQERMSVHTKDNSDLDPNTMAKGGAP